MADGGLEAAAAELLVAKYGQKDAIVTRLAEQLGVSRATAYSRLRPILQQVRPRKRRSDAGHCVISATEARTTAAMLEETRRLTGSGTMPLEEVMRIARANDLIQAGRVDTDTGEFTPVSASTMRRAMRVHHVHPNQLQQPTPAIELSSPHPNWCWQVDASVSRQFYLADDGARILDKRQFYRGKPANFAKINERRIWRYAITDHASGTIEVFYAQGAESALNLVASLIHAMTERADGTMHGVPHILMTDPGSGMTAAATRNFCAALGIELVINKVGNARAKGQVERAHGIVEVNFEAALKFTQPVTSIAEINAMAQLWAYNFNATKIHTRTGVTRRDAWLRITPQQLHVAPAVDVLRSLASSEPKECTVRDGRIRFRGAKWDVTGVPELCNGDKLQVLRNVFDGDATVRIVREAPDGSVTHLLAPCVETDDYGFSKLAAEIGTEHKRLVDTPADIARKQIEQLAMQVATEAEAKSARKTKRLIFNGAVDPHKHLRATLPVTALPRAGTPAQVDAPRTLDAPPAPLPANPPREFAPLSHADAARTLKPLVERRGGQWSATCWARIAERWPNGLPVDQVEAFADELVHATRLRVVGGAA